MRTKLTLAFFTFILIGLAVGDTGMCMNNYTEMHNSRTCSREGDGGSFVVRVGDRSKYTTTIYSIKIKLHTTLKETNVTFNSYYLIGGDKMFEQPHFFNTRNVTIKDGEWATIPIGNHIIFSY